MERIMTSESAKNAVENTLESIKERTPAYRELIDRFGPLFLMKASLRDSLVEKGLTTPDIQSAKFSAGVPVLAGNDCSSWKSELYEIAVEMLPKLSESLQLDKKARSVLQDFFADSDNILGLAQARIDGNWKHFENTSKQLDVIPDNVLLYISENVCSPVFSAIAEILGKSLLDHSWENGNCPVCGSSPSISQLATAEITGLDQLVSGGGKKCLHCSLCGHDWPFKRNAYYAFACRGQGRSRRSQRVLGQVRYPGYCFPEDPATIHRREAVLWQGSHCRGRGSQGPGSGSFGNGSCTDSGR